MMRSPFHLFADSPFDARVPARFPVALPIIAFDSKVPDKTDGDELRLSRSLKKLASRRAVVRRLAFRSTLMETEQR